MSWRRYRDFSYRDYWPRSQRRQAKGGIKAQSRSGGFGKNWWAQRWIAVLEGFQIGARLGRGRSYARSGQVLSIDIEEGRVTAMVQGSRPKPYDVTIEVKTLNQSAWNVLAKALSRQAVFAAKLLAGEMPQDIESTFQKAGLSLFPEKLKDLKTDCSCPDWSNPCKHIAAVYYLLGEEFDRDPFLIFKLRGMNRQEFIGLLGASGGSVVAKACGEQSGVEPPAETPATETLPPEPGRFWKIGPLPDDFCGEVSVPPVSAGLVRQLGSFPFWRARERFIEAMESMYEPAARLGMDVFLGSTMQWED